ncbi:hypothetical protein BT69DRAFT_1400991 [Atractiella rhizophila]|nr:hypothetical protein BT69DRAFT_1400991 [Atractiella rhizophila]
MLPTQTTIGCEIEMAPSSYGEVVRPVLISVVLSFCLWGIGLSQSRKILALELSALLVVDVVDSLPDHGIAVLSISTFLGNTLYSAIGRAPYGPYCTMAMLLVPMQYTPRMNVRRRQGVKTSAEGGSRVVRIAQ